MNFQLAIAGAIALNAAALALFFFRFWRKKRDSLFACFSLAFALLAIERLFIIAWLSEIRPVIYLIRLAAFLLIAFAILQKNRRG
jgi:hypothetical protein